ncbi:hypothetical protein [Cryptosporangium sp. NPDC048952]|uniref:hypothetical protein n=1 Tax=Cryptosporangium sp. NPDC048952 TaxID=3363961 RepID=UPI00371B1786
MDGTSRLRVGEVVAVFAPLAEALAPGDGAGHLAALAVRSLLGLPTGPALPAEWPERLVANGVPAGLVTVLAAAVAGRRPTAGEVATALRATCDPIPLRPVSTAEPRRACCR